MLNKKPCKMKTQHTKGEWNEVVGLHSHNDYFIHSKGKAICKMPSLFSKANEEVQSNAKLIAAAPELLKAAIECCESDNTFKLKEARESLLKAIKKATK